MYLDKGVQFWYALNKSLWYKDHTMILTCRKKHYHILDHLKALKTICKLEHPKLPNLQIASIMLEVIYSYFFYKEYEGISKGLFDY